MSELSCHLSCSIYMQMVCTFCICFSFLSHPKRFKAIIDVLIFLSVFVSSFYLILKSRSNGEEKGCRMHTHRHTNKKGIISQPQVYRTEQTGILKACIYTNVWIFGTFYSLFHFAVQKRKKVMNKQKYQKLFHKNGFILSKWNKKVKNPFSSRELLIYFCVCLWCECVFTTD